MDDLSDEVLSSPIVNRDDNMHDFGIHGQEDSFIENESHSHHKHKKCKKVDGIEDPADLATWSSAKRTAWASIKTNPNAFFYRHVAPGVEKRTGAWDEKEKKLFMEAIKVHPPSTGKWGLFAQLIPGRVGYQCRNYYHRLLQTGELTALTGELEKIRRKKHSDISIPPVKSSKSSSKSKKHNSHSHSNSHSHEEIIYDEDEIDMSLENSEVEDEPEEKDEDFNEINEIPLIEQPIKSEKKNNKTSKIKKIVEDIDLPDIESISFYSRNHPLVQIGNIKKPSHNININDNLSDFENYNDNDNENENEDDNENAMEQFVLEKPLKWSPRMKEPWKLLHNQPKKLSFVEDSYLKDFSNLEEVNRDHPLNYILFSIPLGDDREEYLLKIQKLMIDGEQEKLDLLLKRYVQTINQKPIPPESWESFKELAMCQ